MGSEGRLLRPAVRTAPGFRNGGKRRAGPDRLLRQALGLLIDEIAAPADEAAPRAIGRQCRRTGQGRRRPRGVWRIELVADRGLPALARDQINAQVLVAA